MRRLREILKGTLLPPGAEEEIALVEKKQREDASYTEYLESRLESQLTESGNKDAVSPRSYRQDWEQKQRDSQNQHGRLEELREKILLLVSQTERLHDAQIAELAGISKQLVTLHLHDLRDAKLVRSAFGLDDRSYQVDVWFIEQPGRKYLFQHGLL